MSQIKIEWKINSLHPISQVGSGSLQDLWWVLYTPPRQFPSSRCKVWRGAKSRHSCQKTGFLLMLLWGKNPPPNARVRFSGNHFTWVIWSVSHALNESKIEKQQHSSSSQYFSLQCLAYPSCSSSAVGTKTHRTSKHWESKKGRTWWKTAENDFKQTISCLS